MMFMGNMKRENWMPAKQSVLRFSVSCLGGIIRKAVRVLKIEFLMSFGMYTGILKGRSTTRSMRNRQPLVSTS